MFQEHVYFLKLWRATSISWRLSEHFYKCIYFVRNCSESKPYWADRVWGYAQSQSPTRCADQQKNGYWAGAHFSIQYEATAGRSICVQSHSDVQVETSACATREQPAGHVDVRQLSGRVMLRHMTIIIRFIIPFQFKK